MALVWTRTALKSVDEIASYIARDNPVRAASFVAELQASTERLVSFPGMGKAGRVPGTRELVLHKNYVAIYRVVRTDVQVLRIQHVAQRY
ncbi:MAG: type II toxin-antitoxin system RelE/ParE family toxin [Polaromonas sp.]